MEKEFIIELKHIKKVFPGGVVANKDISFSVEKGEIHSICGENGAGKTTLMNMIFGLIQPTSGDIILRGKKTTISSATKAIELALGMVHQHFMLIKDFTVLQNIVLGSELSDKLVIDYDKCRKMIKDISDKYSLDIADDIDSYVREISVPKQQKTEIIKVLWREAEIIIFDEPTAVLTPQEIDEFCKIVLTLKEQGKTILFISHKLAEVMQISDSVTVIRHGEVVCTKKAKDTNASEIAELMVGRKVSLGGGERQQESSQKTLLTLKNISYEKNGKHILDDVNLELSCGEILGIAGVDGNGQDELVDIICGKTSPTEGAMIFNGENINNLTLKQRKKKGMSFVFEDRHKDGLVLDFPIKDNFILGYQDEEKFLKHKFIQNHKSIDENAEWLRREYSIRSGSINSAASTLSGGNQQKVILAREIFSDPKILLTVQPTRGLDMGAIAFVHEKLVEQRNLGKGILFFSLELDEILQLCDKIAVIYDGKIIKCIPNKNVSRNIIGQYMLGITNTDVVQE